ncbi:MAG: hypothetical protein V9E81_04035 [Marmoricola sp.]
MTAGSTPCPDSAADIRMRRALHRGGPDALNLYFTRPRDGTLGFSAFPWDYKRPPTQRWHHDWRWHGAGRQH